MIDEQEFRELMDSAEDSRREADRAAGALAQHKKRLRDEFGCKTLEEAEAKEKELAEEEKRTEAAYRKELAKLKKKWGSILGDTVEES